MHPFLEANSFLDSTMSICSKGTYVLQDNNFQLLTQMSDGKQYTEEAPKVTDNNK